MALETALVQDNATPYSGFTLVADINGDGIPDLLTVGEGELTVRYGVR